MKFGPGAGRRLALGLSVALVTVLLDQLSKWYILTHVPEADGGRVPFLPFLDFTLAWNHGVSFSMGNTLAYSRLIFAALSVIVSIALVLWMARGAKPAILVALGLVTGGAVGNNCIDRVRFGAVEDFLYFHVAGFDWWPVFNVADSAICIGAAVMVFDSLFDRSLSHKNTP